MMIHLISILLWFMIVPLMTGVLVLGLLHREESGICLSFSVGYMTMFALFQIIAFPMIVLKLAFHIVFYVTAGVYLLLIVLSIFLYWKRMLQAFSYLILQIKRTSWTVYLAIVSVLAQCYVYFFYKTENADDAYYVATAAVTLAWDTMYLRSPYTGIPVDSFNIRYICAPYPIFQAFMAKATGLPAAVIAHTVLPPFLVLVAYASFTALAKMLFSEEGAEGENALYVRKKTGLFIALLSWINITSYYCMKTTGSVLLIRVWQGKATVGAVIVPFLFYICYRMALYKEEMKSGMWLLLIGTMAANLPSSMSIALVPTMLGIFALLFGLFKKNWRYFFCMILGTAPCVLMGCANLIIRFVQR